ncbi:MAG: hypothetical protein FWF24_05095 [Alphaproteobacteria bacterium]|nr:hypothetical protein [Alphaproteobacteria bacterium]
MRFLFSFLVVLAALTGVACAQNDQLVISAEQSLEWHEDQQLYIARQDARAVRGPLTLEADLLMARRWAKDKGISEKAGQRSAIDLVTAEGNVRIFDDKQKLVGDRATYDLDKGWIRVTGAKLCYESQGSVITARDSFDYDEKAQKAFAHGKVVALHQGHKVKADKMAVTFRQNEAGRRELSMIEAWGEVDILTKDGVLARGDHAVYTAHDDMANLAGHVRITRQEVHLEGDRAVLQFGSGESQLLNEGGGRVRALLPSSGKGADSQ